MQFGNFTVYVSHVSKEIYYSVDENISKNEALEILATAVNNLNKDVRQNDLPLKTSGSLVKLLHNINNLIDRD